MFSAIVSLVARRHDRPLHLLGAWHLACAAVGGASVLPMLSEAVRHPVGWTTLGLITGTAVVGVALVAGKRDVLRTAALLQGAQVLAVSVPGLAVWIVRVGLRVSISVPALDGRGVLGIGDDATVFTIWGAAARLPLGVSVNLCALVAFALCLSCLPDRAGQLHVDSA